MKKEEIYLTEETFNHIRDFIYEKTGIYFLENKKYLLESRLINRVKECNCRTFEDYYYFLKYDQSKKELQKFYDSITTNETSFFRNPPQFVAFENSILPQVLDMNRQKMKKRIRIWSAACSTGEEPYTIAMILLENQLKARGWEIEIVATDISEMALSSARNGIYKKNRIDDVPQKYLYKYFDNSDESYKIKREVRGSVKFDNANLIEDYTAKKYQGFDIVFCRNVLIYFDDEAKKKVIARIYDVMVPGGYLFLGHSESLHNISRAFKLLHHDKAVVYKKE